MHRGDLLHHAAVDVQPACGVDDKDLGMGSARLLQRAPDDGDRGFAGIAVAVHCTDLARQCLQLQDCGGTMHVDADEHDAFLFLLHDPLGELRRGRRLTGTLQAGK